MSTISLEQPPSQTEALGPDPDFIKLVHRIMDQNQQILTMNSGLLKTLASPICVWGDKDAGGQ